MKKLLLFFFIYFLTGRVMLSAQIYHVSDIVEVQQDLSARTNPRKDDNGKDCALIKVNIPSIKKITFSNCVGDVKYLPGEFNLYVPEGTKMLSFSFSESDRPQYIDFNKYGIEVKSKSVYKVTIRPSIISSSNNECSLFISANIAGAIVLIDGIPFGQTPFTATGLSSGKHVLSVPNTIGYSMEDKEIIVSQNGQSSITLNLSPYEFKDMGLDYGGFEIDTWLRNKVIKTNGKMGIADLTGKVVVPPDYEHVYNRHDRNFYQVNNNGKSGIYKSGYGLIAECIYDKGFITKLTDDCFKAKKNNMYGCFNSNGEEIIPFIFNRIDISRNSNQILASINTSNGKIVGVFNLMGETIIEPRLAEQKEYSEGMSVGSYNILGKKQFFIVDLYGKEIEISNIKETGDQFYSGLLKVKSNNGKWGFINKKGEQVIPCIYDFVDDFAYGYAYGTIGENIQYLNDKGVIIGNETTIANTYNVFGGTSFLITKRGNKYGLINVKGDVILPPIYDKIAPGDLIVAEKDNDIMVFDDNANYLFSKPRDIKIEYVKDGFFIMIDEESETYGFINKQGVIIGNCIYSYKAPFRNKEKAWDIESIFMSRDYVSEGMAMLIIGDRVGFMDIQGKITVPCIYSAALPFEDGNTFVRKQDGEWIRIDKYNNQIN